METDEGSNRDVKVNEFQCAIAAAAGRRKPSEAGIRMGNEKYMFIMHDPEFGSCQLSR
jgi:hypothetical protein